MPSPLGFWEIDVSMSAGFAYIGFRPLRKVIHPMANRPVPPKADRKRSKVLKALPAGKVRKQSTSLPTFNRLTVEWVQGNGVPFNTTEFFARLTRNNVLVSTAFFDSFGVVRFNNIGTLTNVSYTLRTFNRNGVLFRTRFIPAGVQTFVIIG